MKLADLIRSMTDEEMAEFFAEEIFNGPICDNCPAMGICDRENNNDYACPRVFLAWLQSFQVSDLLYRVERRIQEEQGKDGVK